MGFHFAKVAAELGEGITGAGGEAEGREDGLMDFGASPSVELGTAVEQHHSSGCPKCARGEGHPLWVLNVGYPGGKTRQVSLRPEQVPQVRQALDRYRETKETLEAISELNQFLLRLDRDEAHEKERGA
jgi:hypothetical protein